MLLKEWAGEEGWGCGGGIREQAPVNLNTVGVWRTLGVSVHGRGLGCKLVFNFPKRRVLTESEHFSSHSCPSQRSPRSKRENSQRNRERDEEGGREIRGSIHFSNQITTQLMDCCLGSINPLRWGDRCLIKKTPKKKPASCYYCS